MDGIGLWSLSLCSCPHWRDFSSCCVLLTPFLVSHVPPAQDIRELSSHQVWLSPFYRANLQNWEARGWNSSLQGSLLIVLDAIPRLGRTFNMTGHSCTQVAPDNLTIVHIWCLGRVPRLLTSRLRDGRPTNFHICSGVSIAGQQPLISCNAQIYLYFTSATTNFSFQSFPSNNWLSHTSKGP